MSAHRAEAREGLSAARPTALVAEDEAVLRDELCQQLQTLWPELQIVGTAGNGEEALRLFEQLRPDVLFVDIQMPGLTGIELAQQVCGRCHIVFVTAYERYAIAAFDAGAIDYLLKPVAVDRLGRALARVRERLTERPKDVREVIEELTRRNAPPTYLRWVKATVGETLQLITVDDVIYFQADNKYTSVMTAGGEARTRRPLQELQGELDPSTFWQIHRSIVVNVAAIHSIHRSRTGNLQLRLKNRDEWLPVSATHAHLFKQL